VKDDGFFRRRIECGQEITCISAALAVSAVIIPSTSEFERKCRELDAVSKDSAAR